MLIKIKKDWELPESAVTSEKVYLDRRSILKSMGFAAAGALLPSSLWAASTGFPSKLNPKYKLPELEPSEEKLITNYNNFYEFSFDKEQVADLAEDFESEPWTMEVSGLVHKPQKFDINDLVKKVGIEQRIYRFRCVEAWSMVVPWDGFPLKKLMSLVEPKSQAKYIKFTTFHTPSKAPGQLFRPHYPWPYTEGLTIKEAGNELSMLVTGLYGKTLPNQNGAPIRLITPWKYGFKSIKSITKVEFTDVMPPTFWNILAPGEYGFYANVNPEVDHPRWTQKRERPIGTWFKKVDTLKYNGYEKEVAHLYKGLDLRKWY